MALSDCEKCWDTPCTCGYQFRNYSEQAMIDQISSMLSHWTSEQKVKILNECLNKVK